MVLMRMIAVAGAVLVIAVQYLQELRRLGTVERLPGGEARDFYERTRRRNERFLLAVAVAFAALAAGAATYYFLGGLRR
jgi:hypothetical protein